MLQILVIEDERKVARFIQKGLAAEGMEITLSETGEDALCRVSERLFDVITVDISLAGMDGIHLIQSLRERQIATPILVVSARGALQDKVRGFEIGADDYLPKPFAFEELLVRIRALARRRDIFSEELRLIYSDLEMDLRTREVTRAGKAIDLTAQEFHLLELFLRHPEEVLTRAKIVETVWREQFDRETNVIEVYIMYVRKKIAVAGDLPPLIHTVRGVGYRLCEVPERE